MEVLDAQKTEFADKFKAIAEQDQVIEKANATIRENMKDFEMLKKSMNIDPARKQFF